MQDLGHCSQQHISTAGAQVQQKLCQPPVRTNAGENLLVFNLTGHHGPGYALLPESLDQAGKFAKGEPMHLDARVSRGPCVHFRFGFFFDGGDHDLNPGETVLDLGSGGGLDVLLSARRVAPRGIAYGLDASPDMLTLARKGVDALIAKQQAVLSTLTLRQ